MEIINKFISKYKQERITSVFCFQNNDKLVGHICTLQKKENKLIIIEKNKFFDVEELFKFLPKDTPITLLTESEKIIHKKVEINESQQQKNIFPFPNLEIKDFYTQTIDISKNEKFITIARKNHIDELLNKFVDEGFFVLRLQMGPFAIHSLLRQIESSPDKISTPPYKLLITDRKINGIEKSNTINNQDLIFFGEHLQGTEILSYAGAFDYLIHKKNDNLIENPTIRSNQINYKFKTIFNFATISSGITIFLLLLISYLRLSHYQEKIGELQLRNSLNAKTLKELNQVEEEYKRKSNFLSEQSITKSSPIAYYGDKIGLTIPKEIKLKELSIFPIKKKIKTSEIIIYENILTLNGQANEEVAIHSWISELKKELWSKETKLISFVHETGKPISFNIKINLENK